MLRVWPHEAFVYDQLLLFLHFCHLSTSALSTVNKRSEISCARSKASAGRKEERISQMKEQRGRRPHERAWPRACSSRFARRPKRAVARPFLLSFVKRGRSANRICVKEREVRRKVTPPMWRGADPTIIRSAANQAAPL